MRLKLWTLDISWAVFSCHLFFSDRRWWITYSGYLQFYVLIIFGHHLIAENSDRKERELYFFPSVCAENSHTHLTIINRKANSTIADEYWGNNKKWTCCSVLLFDSYLLGSRGFGRVIFRVFVFSIFLFHATRRLDCEPRRLQTN